MSVLTAEGTRAPEQAMGTEGTGPSFYRCAPTRETEVGLSLPPPSSCSFFLFSHLQPGFLAPRQLSQFELTMNKLGR